MKKNIYAFLFLLPLSSLAQCLLNVSPGAPTVCAGDSVTLTAYGTNATTLNASSTAGNNHRGNMFDLVATNDVIINSFDASPMGNTIIEIYYRIGSFNGYANNPGAWTFIGSASVTYTGAFVPVAVPVNITIPAGQTYAFYVTSTQTSVSLNYSNGTSQGAVYASDANLSFLEGGGMEYPFTSGTGAVYSPRVWNGAIHYTPVASAPAVTYTWSTAETTAAISQPVSTPTQYTVQADITGCPTMSVTVDVNVLALPTVYAGADLSICPGVPATLTATGAQSYTWDNGVTDGVIFTPAATASYVVTGTDAQGCKNTDSVTVTLYPVPPVSAGADITACTGDSIILAGSGADSYTWDNGVTDSLAFVPAMTMDYIVEGMDINSCTNTDTVTVFVNTFPTVSGGSYAPVCDGSLITLAASGADTYAWDNGVTDGVPFPAVAGTYMVVGTSNGCSDTDIVVISVNTVNVQVTVTDSLLTAIVAGADYQWLDCGNGNIPVTNETDQSFIPTMGGSYAVEVTENGCVDTSHCETVILVGLKSLQQNDLLSVYPNPTSGQLTISTETVVADEIAVLDFSGRVIKSIRPVSAQTNVSLETFANGIYLVRVVTANRVQIVKVPKN